jgi:hypothetical protein
MPVETRFHIRHYCGEIRPSTEGAMSTTLMVHDQTAAGDTIHSLPLEFPSDRITVRDLIRERVYQEVHDYNRKSEPAFRGLIQPTGSELILNGPGHGSYQRKANVPIDWKTQFDKALQAFERNGFFILIDDHQAEELEQMVVIGKGTQVSFVKLTPMVGG